MNIGTYEAKTRFTQLLKRVERGETIVITRHDRPVARLVPHDVQADRPVREIVDDIKKFRAGRNLRDLKVKDLIAEGRL